MSLNPVKPPKPKVFVVRVTDPGRDHRLLGYAFVEQTAFVPAAGRRKVRPEVEIVLKGLERLFEKAGEYALAAVPFEAENDPTSGSLVLGANVSAANVEPDISG